MESTATRFIDLIKRTEAVPVVIDGTYYSYYSCKSVACEECCYYGDCADPRITDFPQSLEYHRKTYPEDFV